MPVKSITFSLLIQANQSGFFHLSGLLPDIPGAGSGYKLKSDHGFCSASGSSKFML